MTLRDGEPVVVDASAIGILLVSRHPAADALASRLRRAHLTAPAHLRVEVDSLLRGLERGGKLSGVEAAAAREVAGSLPIELWDWSLVADRAWELRENLTTYDAGYVALAEQLGAVLVTADSRIGRAPGIRCRIDVIDGAGLTRS